MARRSRAPAAARSGSRSSDRGPRRRARAARTASRPAQRSAQSRPVGDLPAVGVARAEHEVALLGGGDHGREGARDRARSRRPSRSRAPHPGQGRVRIRPGRRGRVPPWPAGAAPRRPRSPRQADPPARRCRPEMRRPRPAAASLPARALELRRGRADHGFDVARLVVGRQEEPQPGVHAASTIRDTLIGPGRSASFPRRMSRPTRSDRCTSWSWRTGTGSTTTPAATAPTSGRRSAAGWRRAPA